MSKKRMSASSTKKNGAAAKRGKTTSKNKRRPRPRPRQPSFRRCERGTRRCRANRKCVAVTPARPAGFRCPRGSKQCPNRICYPSRKFATSPRGVAIETIQRAWRGRQMQQRNYRRAVFVALAMSHERAPDRQRLIALLDIYEVVVGVSNIAVPTNNADYGNLLPFFLQRRYIYISQDFNNFDRMRNENTNAIVRTLRQYRDRGFAERIVFLDYFFLQTSYFRTRYGMNWLLKRNPNLNFGSRGRQGFVEGKAKDLLAGATDVYLPVDSGGDMQEMVRQYRRDLPDHAKTMRLDFVAERDAPLFQSDDSIDIIVGRPSARQNVQRYLDKAQPFLRVRPAI